MTEVIKQLSNQFEPQPKIIKDRIELLIEKEYMERDQNERSVYNYLA
jgi:hypothetical protein